tara:strand:- start:10695 stop:11081 length:387 start_codon:yes stop_codon:yes gene_type:complete
MPYVLDTTILIELEKKKSNIISKLKTLPPDELQITYFTLCEYYYGIIKKSPRNRLKALKSLFKYNTLYPLYKSALIFCELKNKLIRSGKEIPDFDLLIASVVMENNSILITMDKHFSRIKGLKTIVIK